MRRHHIRREVDPPDRAEILGAILRVVDDLKRRTQCVRCWPSGVILAMHIQHIAPDRHRRIAAIFEQRRPIGIAIDRAIALERDEQVERVLRA
jgi:hypothetical protein